MSTAKKSAPTPMMQQYWRYREEVPEDALLLFRLGDFYELFHGDAENGADVLGITLTQRSGYPMAGIPYHAANTYIPKLLKAGYKVAIVDQIETPRPGKLVKRALTRILTPGTALEDNQLEASKHHFLLALSSDKKAFYAAWLDLSTGEFQIAREPDPARLMPLLHALDPREILLPETTATGWAHREDLQEWYADFDHYCLAKPVTHLPDFQFEPREGAKIVQQTLGVLGLDGFGVDSAHPALGPAGAVIQYATDSLCESPRNLRKIQEYRTQESLLLDPATLRNLEIFRTAQGGRDGSLIAALDRTVTAAGGRLLESFLTLPLLDIERIRQRHQLVEEFLQEPGVASRVQDLLKQVRDIARILGRLQNRLRNPRELGAIRSTLEVLPPIREALAETSRDGLATLRERVEPFEELRALLGRALYEELPSQIQDGNIFADRYDAELDRLRSLSSNNKMWLADLEAREQQETGIKTLRIKYNGAFGYYIEISKGQAANAPERYIRKQTMKNAERYVTEELRQKEKEILNAEEKSVAREEELFRELVDQVLQHADGLRATAEALAEIDLFAGWSQLAREWDYCRPEMDDADILDIEQGRHPVIEQMLRRAPGGLGGTDAFVPNDTFLSASQEQIALLTGPNMAGKSTYIRQVALIVLIAQIGCWVPARGCRIGVVDRIFSRVGASDELARGNSTFMVEMNETANILNYASPHSLIILDEIGRGTSTYDGLSIAWAVIEHIHEGIEDIAKNHDLKNGAENVADGESEGGAPVDHSKIKSQKSTIGPRTLFATHYHEVTKLEETLPRLRNYCVAVKEWNDEIIFVRQVIPGAADRSYGIQVARLAGLPESVISRAKAILEELESTSSAIQKQVSEAPQRAGRKPKSSVYDGQLSLF